MTLEAVGHWFTGPGGDATGCGTQGVTPQAVGHKGVTLQAETQGRRYRQWDTGGVKLQSVGHRG